VSVPGSSLTSRIIQTFGADEFREAHSWSGGTRVRLMAGCPRPSEPWMKLVTMAAGSACCAGYDCCERPGPPPTLASSGDERRQIASHPTTYSANINTAIFPRGSSLRRR
jgi:hypothetical protein